MSTVETAVFSPARRSARPFPPLSLFFPWIVLMGVVGIIRYDWVRAGAAVGQAVDPVCKMSVRKASAHPAVIKGGEYFFCSVQCLESFSKDPSARRAGHSMRGIPTWMYQAGMAMLLLVSFVLFGYGGRKAGAEPLPARFELTALPGVQRALAWPPFVPGLRVATSALFLFIIAAGLFGNQNPAMNIAPLLTWTVWWTGLIFVVLFLGKAWCTVCPWDALAGWAEKLKAGGLGLGLRWPSSMRNIWPAVGFFLLLTWIELGMGITVIPRATAWVALGMLALATVSAFLFERKAFCRYGCLVGRISGLYAMFSSLELRARDPAVCAACSTMDCYRGNARGEGCPTFEFPKTMKASTYCTLCAECFKTCPSGNIALRLRPWGADLARGGRPRADEAFLSLALLSMTAFHGLTMTPSWTELAQRSGASFTALMALCLIGPVALYALLSWAAAALSRAQAGFKAVFMSFAYALLPIALFYHLAHNAEHFLMEGPKVLALASDPLGRGWDLFGTAAWTPPPLVTLEGLWPIQVLFILIGHVYSLWVTERTARRLIPVGRSALLCQLPMLAAMAAFSALSLWLLRQPMEMRVSGM